MIDSDDVGDGFMFGGIAFGLILLVIYLVFSKPEIDDCHKRGGVMIKVEGESKCIDQKAIVEVKK